MQEEKDYFVSSAYVDELLRPLKGAGHFEAVLAELGPRTTQMVLKPWDEQWHPAVLTESLGEAIVKIAGDAFYSETVYKLVKNRFGPILIPLLSSTLKKGSPAGLFSRLEGLVDAAVKGVGMRWDKKSERSGTLWVFYPRQVSPVLEYNWRGVIRFIFEITKHEGKIDAFQLSDSGNVLEYRVSWTDAIIEPAPPPAAAAAPAPKK
jgi:hypothetical protein